MSYVIFRIADYKGLLHDLHEIQNAHKGGSHKKMPNFIAGSQDMSAHLQVLFTSPPSSFSFLFPIPSPVSFSSSSSCPSSTRSLHVIGVAETVW